MMAFVSILVTLLIATLNWRIQLRHDHTLDAYVRLQSGLDLLKSCLTLWDKANHKEEATYRISLFEPELAGLLTRIREDRHRMALLYANHVDSFYSEFDNLIGEYLKCCLTLSLESSDKELCKDLFWGLDDAYNKRIACCKSDVESNFNYLIFHPYKCYFCLKFKKYFQCSGAQKYEGSG